MAIDLDLIRKRMAQLNGSKKTSSVQLWKPGPGEYKIRCLPWKNVTDGQPFVERWFYYIGNNSGILTPKQFGKPDPIDDLIRKLYSSGKPADRELAKKLQPKMRAYTPVIVRGEEDKGVMVWSFGKIVYQRLLGFFIDEDCGDILDPLDGHDLKVTITQQPGKTFADTTVDFRAKTSKVHDDVKTMESWLESVPNIDDMYRLKSKEEIENVLNAWLSGGDTQTPDEGTARGAAPVSDALDALVKDVKAGAASNVVVEEAKPARSKKKPVVEDDDATAPPVKQMSLDDAFKELTDEELSCNK